MARFPRTGTQPETMVKILLTVIDKTPSGGATLEDLKEAYAEINDREPSARTIYRYIRRLNLLFDPLCYGERPEPGEEDLAEDNTDEAVTGEKAICSKRLGGKTYYTFAGKKSDLLTGNNDVTMMLLGMYPQLRGAMKKSIEAAMESIFRQSLSGLCTFAGILSELEHVVHVSGAFPADPAKSEAMIREILRAIKERKRVRIKYLRTYDGAITERWWSPMGCCAVLTTGTSPDCVPSGSKGGCYCRCTSGSLKCSKTALTACPPAFR